MSELDKLNKDEFTYEPVNYTVNRYLADSLATSLTYLGGLWIENENCVLGNYDVYYLWVPVWRLLKAKLQDIEWLIKYLHWKLYFQNLNFCWQIFITYIAEVKFGHK